MWTERIGENYTVKAWGKEGLRGKVGEREDGIKGIRVVQSKPKTTQKVSFHHSVKVKKIATYLC